MLSVTNLPLSRNIEMKFRFFLILSVILFGSTLARSQTVQANPAFQSWNEVQLILPLMTGKDARAKSFDRLTLTLNGIMRFGRKPVEAIDDRAGATFDHRINKYLFLTTGVLYRKDELVIDRRRYETRFDAGATLAKTWRGFVFRDRNLYEHRFRNSRADLDLYRQKIQVSYPVKRGDRELFAPFISEEGYYDLRLHGWIQNEFFAGVSRKISPKTSIDVSYIRADGTPVDVNGISFSLRIRLK